MHYNQSVSSGNWTNGTLVTRRPQLKSSNPVHPPLLTFSLYEHHSRVTGCCLFDSCLGQFGFHLLGFLSDRKVNPIWPGRRGGGTRTDFNHREFSWYSRKNLSENKVIEKFCFNDIIGCRGNSVLDTMFGGILPFLVFFFQTISNS